MVMNKCLLTLCLVFCCTVCALAEWKDASAAGEILKYPPTLHCLGVHWVVKGDKNENASVDVRFRKAGEDTWREGMPLFRGRPDRGPSGQTPLHNVENGWLFAGSVVDLIPDTEYEVKLLLKDPDGGNAEKVLKMKTWKEPMPPQGMRERHVVPLGGSEPGGAGTAGDPIRGLQTAVNRAKPGDLFLLHKGVYVNGTLNIRTSGDLGNPIIFRGAGDGEAVLNGGKGRKRGGRLVSGVSTSHIWFEDVTFRNRSYLIVAHKSSHWVLRRCRFLAFDKAFVAHNGGFYASQHHFISDNYFKGYGVWPRKGIRGGYGTFLTGSGHVICYNRFEHVGDGVHGSQYGFLSASDIHNNDAFICEDDGYEADETMANTRYFDNRVINTYHGYTTQPIHGGPAYIYRNLAYNCAHAPLKIYSVNSGSSGIVIYQNTFVCRGWGMHQDPRDCTKNLTTRNNLFIGSKAGYVTQSGWYEHSDMQNDGFGGAPGRSGKPHIKVNSKKSSIYNTHPAILIDNTTCFEMKDPVPKKWQIVYRAEDIDLRLGRDSGALDKGVRLPNFNDGYTGKAPDLGCYERGKPLPHYGPRPRGFSLTKEILKHAPESRR